MNVGELIHLWENLHLFGFTKNQVDRLRKATLLNIYTEMDLAKYSQSNLEEVYKKASEPLEKIKTSYTISQGTINAIIESNQS